MLIVGGIRTPYPPVESDYLASAELFDPATGQFHEAGALSYGRGLHAAALLADGRVAIFGGGNHPEVEIYDPGTGQFAVQGSLVAASEELIDPATGAVTLTLPMPFARSDYAAVALPDGRGLIIGGSTNRSIYATAMEYLP